MRRDKTAQRINELDAMLWDEITSNSSKQDHYGLIPSPARVKELEGQVKSRPKAPVAGGYTTLLGRALGNIKYITAFIVIAFTFVSPFSHHSANSAEPVWSIRPKRHQCRVVPQRNLLP